MILTDIRILEELAKGTIVISPFDRKYLGSNSYDVHLARHLAVYAADILDAGLDRLPKRGPAALDGRGDVHRLAVFRNGAPRDVDALAAQDFDDPIVGKNVVRRFAFNEFADPESTASAEWASPPALDAIEAVKKYFSSKMPRGVAMYLLAVTRETVDSALKSHRPPRAD